MNLKEKGLYILFLLNSICISAQDFISNKLDIGNDRIQFIISDDKNLIIVGEDSVWEYNEGEIRKYRAKPNQNKTISHIGYTLIESNNKHLAVENGLGRVFNITKDSITRIDNSASLKNNFGNSVFIHDQNIISYGGYGFWKYHDFFTRYSWKDNEWFFIRHSNQNLPIGRSKPYFQVDGNDLFIAGGDNEKNRLNDVHLINLNTLKSEKLGTLSSEFTRRTRPLKYITLDNVNFYIEREGLQWMKVDLKENYFSKAKKKSHLKTHFLESNPIIHSDSIFYICTDNDVLRMNSMSIKDFKNSFIEKNKLFFSEKKINNFLVVFFIVMFLITLRVIYIIDYFKKRKYVDIFLQKHYVTHSNSIIVLTKKENLLLRKFIMKSELSITDFAEMKIFNEYSDSNKKKEVLKIIKKLNSKFLNDKKLSGRLKIEMAKNKIDEYSLKGKIKIYDGWYKHFWSNP